jgi:solute:Na+ symporter, SSS family
LRTLDIIVVIAYLAGVVWVGLHFRERKNDSGSFFHAHGGFRGVVGAVLVGLSMAATFFSGISFVVYTSTAYSDGIRILLGAAALPLSWLVLRYWFLPRYLADCGRHPYDILETRFGPAVRLTVSAMFMLLRIAWMAVMLIAPTLVLTGAANLGPDWFWPVILLTGVTCTLYTAIGGIRSVIITDAIQFIVMVLGVLLIIGFMLRDLNLPAGEVLQRLQDAGRLRTFDFSLDFTKAFTVWGLVFGIGLANLGNYLGDLMMLQRYMASDSPRGAARASAINIIGVILVISLLVICGLLLWLWYQQHPDPGLPAKADQVLAYFAARELPPGLAGLLIAAILASTMSSMTSGIIALAGTFTNDWVRRFGRARSEQELIGIGRWTSIIVGLLAILVAGFASELGTLFQISQAALGAFLGPMLGCMVLAVSGLRARPAAMLAGLALGTVTGWVLIASPIAVVWVGAGSALATIAVTLLAPKPPAPAP